MLVGKLLHDIRRELTTIVSASRFQDTILQWHCFRVQCLSQQQAIVHKDSVSQRLHAKVSIYYLYAKIQADGLSRRTDWSGRARPEY